MAPGTLIRSADYFDFANAALDLEVYGGFAAAAARAFPRVAVLFEAFDFDGYQAALDIGSDGGICGQVDGGGSYASLNFHAVVMVRMAAEVERDFAHAHIERDSAQLHGSEVEFGVAHAAIDREGDRSGVRDAEGPAIFDIGAGGFCGRGLFDGEAGGVAVGKLDDFRLPGGHVVFEFAVDEPRGRTGAYFEFTNSHFEVDLSGIDSRGIEVNGIGDEGPGGFADSITARSSAGG